MKTLIILIFCLVALPAFAIEPANFYGVTWHDCFDGDTCRFTIADLPPSLGEKAPVRLRGLDAPEMRAGCPEEKILAIKSRDSLTTFLAAAKRIDLIDLRRGHFERFRATVMIDGKDAAAIMIAAGLARPWRGRRENWCP